MEGDLVKCDKKRATTELVATSRRRGSRPHERLRENSANA